MHYLRNIEIRIKTKISWEQRNQNKGLDKTNMRTHRNSNTEIPEQKKSRQEMPQKLTQLGPRFHPRHLIEKRTAQKDAIKDTTSDSHANSCFPYRWPPANLTFNIYFYLFSYLYITSITINNGTPHLKSPENQNRRAALGQPALKLLGGGLQLVCGRPDLALSSALIPQTLSCSVCIEDS